jgi:threonine/homoserine efflux transporter RhtA
MMTAGLQVVLLMFALVGFGGAGASLAVAKSRQTNEGDYDAGMLGVAGMLAVFGALCTAVSSGFVGVLAFGGVTLWAGYVLTAQRVGMFHVETGFMEEAHAAEPRQTT